MIISARTQMLSRKPVSEILELYSSLGFKGIEFGLLDYNFCVRPDLLEDYIIEHNMELINKYGLKVTAVSNHLGYINDDYSFEMHKRAIPKVPCFGTNVYIISAGFVSAQDKLYNLDVWKKFVERTKELLKVAQTVDVTLAIEPEPGQLTATTKDYARLKEEVGAELSKNLKMNFDIGHGYLMEPDLIECIKNWHADIAHCHIENMRRGEHIHLPPDEGEIDMKKVLVTLQECGFDGGLALDLYLKPYDETAKPALEYLTKLM